MKRAALLVATLALVTASAPAASGDSDKGLMAQGDAWNAAYAAADWARLRGLYADDAWLMSDKAPAVKGADVIIAYLRGFRDMGASVTFSFEPEDVRIDGRIGTMVAKYQMTAQLPGRPMVRTAGRSLLIYRRQNGRWKLWRDMDNTTPDATVAK